MSQPHLSAVLNEHDDPLLALSRLVASLAHSPDALKLCAPDPPKGPPRSAELARGRLDLLARQVKSMHKKETKAREEVFSSSAAGFTTKRHEKMVEDEERRIKLAYQVVADELASGPFREECLRQARELRYRFEVESGLSEEAQERFRKVVGLGEYMPHPTAQEPIKADGSTVDLLKKLVEVRAIESRLRKRTTVQVIGRALRGPSKEGRRTLTKTRKHKKPNSHLEIGHQAQTQRVEMSERMKRIYQL